MDTLRASEMLQDAGLDPATAKAVVTVVHESVETAAATKLDLRNTEGRLNKKIDENFATLDKKITDLDKKIDVGLAEVRTEIATSVNRASRELMFFIGFVGAIVGLLANAEAIVAALL